MAVLILTMAKIKNSSVGWMFDWLRHFHRAPKFQYKNRIPVGIVLYQGEIYVACVRHNKPESVYPIKLNRVNSVKDFSLFNEHEGHVERVVLTFPSDKKSFVEEYPYHQSMKIKERKGLLRVTMDVNVTRQLKQWVLSHTENGVEVLKSKHLRDDLRKIGLGIAEKYRWS